MKNYYYEIEWYDNSYSGCWRFNNRFKSLKEAVDFMDSDKCLSDVDLRIVCKVEEVIETIKRK